MMRRGLTLLELLVAMTMTVFVVAAAASAFIAAIGFDKSAAQAWDQNGKRVDFEGRLTQLLRGAYITAAAADTQLYFVGESTGTTNNDVGADSLTFSTTSQPVNGVVLTDTTDDFTAVNQRFGPQGGVAEVQLSTTAVGQPAASQTGLFIREQRPSDGDRTQGGFEQVLSADVQQIQFEFYNGTGWQATWDTTATEGRRIPSAVRVSYKLTGDSQDAQRVFIVQLPDSDVTQANPVAVATP